MAEPAVEPHRSLIYTLFTQSQRRHGRKKGGKKSHGGSRGREKCYDRNENPTHVHINALHSTMSPSHRKKGSIYWQHSGLSVPSCAVSGKQVVSPFQGFSLCRILLIQERPSITLYIAVLQEMYEMPTRACSPEVTRMSALIQCVCLYAASLVAERYIQGYVKCCSEERK